MDSTEWPEDRWFALALLLPQVYRLAGTEGGVRLALKTIMNLDVIRFSAKPDFVFQRSRKATALPQEPDVVQWGFDTLGLTTTLGPKIEVTRTLVVEVGPLELSTWEALQDPTEITLLRNTLDLIMPIERGYRVRAVVGDPADCPTFGDDRDDAPSMNCSLGIDTHIGRPDRPSVDSVAFPL